jgi:hypothetical protein
MILGILKDYAIWSKSGTVEKVLVCVVSLIKV